MSNKIILPNQRRKNRIRSKISWTSDRPRLSVFKSIKYLRVQLIDDENWVTLFAWVSWRTMDWAKELWWKIASESWFKKLVFDRGWYKYHWLVKCLADEARKWGVNF